ncbi:MAG: aspartate aminotransferase [Desulfuromonadales bacterium]|jgi:hypothetical protein|nr:aspartate aminotransferase [Desulfuromonadales bacterium]
MLPALNPLIPGVKESATRAINLKALQMRSEGREVYHFGFGQSSCPHRFSMPRSKLKVISIR